jgi:chromosome partitioning protein
MNKILALVATKGGCGKSTLAACLAGEFQHRNKDVALLDIDPQRTLSAWHANEGALSRLPIGSANGASVEPSLKALQKKHALVICDTAGFSNRDTFSALTLANIALVPFGASPADALGAATTVRLLRDVNSTVERQKNPIRILLVMNGAGRGGLVEHIRQEVEHIGEVVLQTSIGRRVAYAEAMLAGTTPAFMGKNASAAAKEIKDLVDELTNNGLTI